MQSEINKKLKKVSNVEKNFIYECEICYEDYDTVKHIPMIICSNYHALCSQCVKSNLFKKEYNAQKNPTGRYMCSKCSEIIQKDDIREHTILKQVCSYIKTIREKDQQLRKEFYNHIGTMGMNLVAMRQDFDTIEKNNLILKKENEFLIKQNCRLTDQFNQIQKIKGSFQELQRVAKQVQDMKQLFIFQNTKLQSLKDEVKRKDQQILAKKNQILAENQKFFSLQGQITQLRQDIKFASKRSNQLLEQNEGAINLKQYLEQEINNLQNQKKKILQENTNKKRKINESLKLMQRYWEETLRNQQKPVENQFKFQNEKLQQKKPQAEKNSVQKNEEKANQLVQSLKNPKSMEKLKVQSKKQQKKISIFDQSDNQIRNFFIDEWTVTVNNRKLTQLAQVSFFQGFNLQQNRSFTIKIKKLQSQQIFVGLMSEQLKHKKKIFDRKGFYAIDGFGKVWIDGEMNDSSKIQIQQGNEIKVQFYKETKSVVFSKNGKKDTQVIRIPQNMKIKALYPVIMLLNDGDSFEVLQVN